MMKTIKRLFVLQFLSIAYWLQAQYNVIFYISDENGNSFSNAKISINKQIKYSDTKGNAVFNLSKGQYIAEINAENYQESEVSFNLNKDLKFKIQLKKINNIEEIVFTAKENKGLTSSSVIDRRAMAHLQPSSFTDLLELLPGKLSQDPNLTSTNVISLREANGRPSQYNTTSLGIQFMIDDNVLNTNANIQNSIDNSHLLSAAASRNTTATGVDMRTISTNDIERVEIIRGIPSAAYGDLSSGLIKIERKISNFPLQARFKADGFSKQFYLGKGASLRDNWQISIGADYLNSKQNPTNEFENYERITSSIRSKIKTNIFQNPLEWRSNLDMSYNLDNEKYDPDIGYAPIDYYKNKVMRISWANNFQYHLPKNFFLSKIALNTSARLGLDRIQQVKLIQQAGLRSVSLATEQGENIGVFPEVTYISDFYTDGKPFDFSAFLKSSGQKHLADTEHHYEIGLDYRFSKNFGEGQVWNPLTPPTSGLGIRQRAFSDIPAWQNIAFFLGDTIHYSLGQHRFQMYMGLRVSKLLGVEQSYKIAKEIFVEPRANFQYSLPHLRIANTPLKTSVTIGYGEFYKQPTLQMLYPNKRYWDYAQLNYYHNNPKFRYVNFMTYVQPIENKELTAAKNIKKEIRIDLSYKKHDLFITLFRETMGNGFRNVLKHSSHTYKRYDVTKVDISKWENDFDLSYIPYETITYLGSYRTTENGSATLKDGIEIGYSSPRIKYINTRFTLRGAWFKTKFQNTVPVVEKPNVTILGNEFPYYGIYQSDYGYINENGNYNLLIDTYIPNLGFTISASLQGTLFDYRKNEPRIPEPIAYYGNDGVAYPFLGSDKTDLYKQWLIRNVSSSDNTAVKYTYTIMANLKVTKRIYKDLETSMFVNRIFNYQHPYHFLGRKIIRKGANAPYFGMELNYNF